MDVDVALMGDLKNVLTDLIPLVDENDRVEWLKQIDQWKQETEDRSIQAWPRNGKLHTSHVIRDIWEATGGDAIVVTGVGQHQMWAAQYYRLEEPHRLITSGGAGTMGFGLPAAIGAWFAHQGPGYLADRWGRQFPDDTGRTLNGSPGGCQRQDCHYEQPVPGDGAAVAGILLR